MQRMISDLQTVLPHHHEDLLNSGSFSKTLQKTKTIYHLLFTEKSILPIAFIFCTNQQFDLPWIGCFLYNITM